jgi:hypothetical protein
MKNLFFLSLSLILAFTAAAQNPRPTKSRFLNSSRSTFHVEKGDILVYHVKSAAGEYDLVITVNRFDSVAAFEYEIPQQGKKGSIEISQDALAETKNYLINFEGNEKLNTASALWLSMDNYTDIADNDEQRTDMQLNNSTEEFKRTSASTMKINYKGKEKIITLLKVKAANSNNEFWVMNDEANPLILWWNVNGVMELKEVR